MSGGFFISAVGFHYSFEGSHDSISEALRLLYLGVESEFKHGPDEGVRVLDLHPQDAAIRPLPENVRAPPILFRPPPHLIVEPYLRGERRGRLALTPAGNPHMGLQVKPVREGKTGAVALGKRTYLEVLYPYAFESSDLAAQVAMADQIPLAVVDGERVRVHVAGSRLAAGASPVANPDSAMIEESIK